MSNELSRRSFLKGAATAAGAAAIGATTAACSSPSQPTNAQAEGADKEAPAPSPTVESAKEDQKWDAETEVLVLGFGGAGAVAAATAFEEGAEVMILEKSPMEGGGSSRMTNGAVSYVTDKDSALEYLRIQVKGLTPDDVWDAYLDEALTILDWLDERGIEYREIPWGGDFKNWPGADSFRGVILSNPNPEENGGAALYNWAKQFMEDNNIEIVFDAQAYKLVQDFLDTKEIIGVLARHSDGGELAVRAKKAVILCTGGFEYNDEMIGNYLVPNPMAHEGWPYNTGDGLKMAVEVGAEMWHMNMYDSYGIAFTAPGDASARFGFGGASCTTGSFMWINSKGQRFINENPCNVSGGYGHRSCNLWATYQDVPGGFPDLYDSQYDNCPFYLLIDQKQFDKEGLYPQKPMGGLTFIPKELGGQEPWSLDNKAELEKGWILKGDTIEEIVDAMNKNSYDEGFRMQAADLQKTVDDYNAMCEAQEDTLFGRPAMIDDKPNLVPLDTPPYYAMRLMPCFNSTKGGPRKNGKAQVLDIHGEVIPRLYAAGTLGHSAARIYCVFGANLAECIDFGRIAGRNAAAEISA